MLYSTPQMRTFFANLFIILCVLLLPIASHASPTDGTIQTQYAWGENVGWVNLAPTGGGGLHITDSGITGYAWDSNYGWINFSPIQSGVLNDGEGHLSGYAWSAGGGYIDFSGVTINSSGRFSGIANGLVYGQLIFDCEQCNVTTDWRPISTRGGSGGSGGGGGGGGGGGPPVSLVPVLVTLSPADRMTNVSPLSNLVITFSKPVITKTGNITIKKTSDSSIVEVISVDSRRVRGSGTNSITVRLSLPLAENTQYSVQVDPLSFADADTTKQTSITSTIAWSFTTGDKNSPLPPDQLTPPIVIHTSAPEPYNYKTFKYLIEDPNFITKLQVAHPDDNITEEKYQNQCVTNNGEPFYRQCELGRNFKTFDDYRASIVCEGFIQEQANVAGYKYMTYPTRKAIVTLALNMRRVPLVSPTEYQHIFTDVPAAFSPIAETSLKYHIVSPNTLFHPDNLVTRAEALVMMMRAVCLKPDTNLGTNWQEQVAKTAYKFGITTRTWEKFEPKSLVYNQELYAFSSRLADYAERFGGCDTSKPEYCFVKK